jgi:hypothetical protein
MCILAILMYINESHLTFMNIADVAACSVIILIRVHVHVIIVNCTSYRRARLYSRVI